MDAFTYTSPEWRDLADRAKARDQHRCTVSRLIGGACHGVLHAHHIEAVADGGAPLDLDNIGTVCASHHPKWESIRRALIRSRRRDRPRCPHRHRTIDSRLICEARLARQRDLVA